jgi:hypothetical protein
MIAERLHQKAKIKHSNLIKELKRNPRCNLWINHILTFFTMILLYILAVSGYSMLLWASIMATDKILKTDTWYLEMIFFIIAHGLAFGEIALLFVGVPLYLNFEHNWYEN